MDIPDTLGEGQATEDLTTCAAIDWLLSGQGKKKYLVHMKWIEKGDPGRVAITFVEDTGTVDGEGKLLACPVYATPRDAFGVSQTIHECCDLAILSGDFNTYDVVPTDNPQDVDDLLDDIYQAVCNYLCA